jgi:hypothetical protein
MILAIPVTFVFVIWMMLVGVPDNISTWIKSFEYPSIEVRYKPLADQLKTVTSDALLKESNHIGQPRYITHPNKFLGIVTGNFTMVFGTNRSFEDVQKDYIQFLSAMPDWNVDSVVYTVTYNADRTAKISVRVLGKNEMPSDALAKYRTVYEVRLGYGDPTLFE